MRLVIRLAAVRFLAESCYYRAHDNQPLHSNYYFRRCIVETFCLSAQT